MKVSERKGSRIEYELCSLPPSLLTALTGVNCPFGSVTPNLSDNHSHTPEGGPRGPILKHDRDVPGFTVTVWSLIPFLSNSTLRKIPTEFERRRRLIVGRSSSHPEHFTFNLARDETRLGEVPRTEWVSVPVSGTAHEITGVSDRDDTPDWSRQERIEMTG